MAVSGHLWPSMNMAMGWPVAVAVIMVVTMLWMMMLQRHRTRPD
jgi:hypothetical protein